MREGMRWMEARGRQWRSADSGGQRYAEWTVRGRQRLPRTVCAPIRPCRCGASPRAANPQLSRRRRRFGWVQEPPILLLFRRFCCCSPKREVWGLFLGPVSSFFGERCGGSPKREVWMGLVDFLTSVFGDHRICRRRRRMGRVSGVCNCRLRRAVWWVADDGGLNPVFGFVIFLLRRAVY